jgi:Protein of unknown function (DUF4242)
MKNYLVELYQPDGPDIGPSGAESARAAAAALTRDGTEVRYLRSIFIPSDETCFHLFEAPSADAVDQVSRRAAFEYERIVEVIQ